MSPSMADPRLGKINILLADTRIRYIFILLKDILISRKTYQNNQLNSITI